jgi:outer membrane receptor protein involved in Fe transport
MKKNPSYTPVAIAVAALLHTGVGFAQESLKLDEVVVTSTSTAKSKLRSSVSVTDVDQEAIKDFGARTESEVLMLIPGIRTEATAGPGGNSNITVRGLPISSGGSKYVQIQEDGLPTVQFGDMNFSNNDYWTRFDNNVDSIQTLRGGSSSVFASHAPGAVINYISKTGKEEGGSMGVTKGLNFNETRFDGDYGKRLSEDSYYHVGGYFRQGEGARKTEDGALKGYQVKGNFTKEFNGTAGYIRFNFKALDEHAPTTPQTYLTATNSGGNVSNFGLAPTFNGLYDSQYSQYNRTMKYVNPATGQISNTSLTDGITSKSKSVGFEFHNEFKDGLSIDNKFRISQNAGAFQTQFWGVQTIDALKTAKSATSATWYNGPNAGQAVAAGTLVSAGGAINVQTPDMGIVVNDFSVAKAFQLEDGKKLTVRPGMFYSRQNVVQTWGINSAVMGAQYNGALIDLAGPSGALTSQGMLGYNDAWGADSAKNINESFTTTAPYLGLNLESGQWDFDGGVRRETFKSNGYAIVGEKVSAATAQTIFNTSTPSAAQLNTYMATKPIYANYSTDYNNYSAGANYRFNNDQSVFARYSVGHRAIADRLLSTPNNFNALGGLVGSGEYAVAPVKQYELGTKTRGNTDYGRYALAATYFHSTTSEFDYDQTRIALGLNPIRELGYKANGIEFESGFSTGNFSVNANVTYSDEKFAKYVDGTNNYAGNAPAGSTKWRYTISPRYTMGKATFGGTVRGVGKMYLDDANTMSVDGHYIASGFLNYEVEKNVVASVNINNLFNKLYPAGTASLVGGTTSYFNAGVETGRTISTTLRYKF